MCCVLVCFCACALVCMHAFILCLYLRMRKVKMLLKCSAAPNQVQLAYTCSLACKLARMLARTHTCTHTHMHAKHTRISSCTHVRLCAHAHTPMCARTHARANTGVRRGRYAPAFCGRGRPRGDSARPSKTWCMLHAHMHARAKVVT